MSRFLAILCLALCSQVSLASGTPEATLNKYFRILTSQDYHDIAELMDPESMSQLKTAMDRAMKFQADRGLTTLQTRIFGEPVSVQQIEATPAEYYLEKLAAEILKAARETHLVVADRQMIGKIRETDDMVHIVARLTFRQDSERASDVLVYTLVRRPGGWKVKFPATIKQMLTVIEGTARQVR